MFKVRTFNAIPNIINDVLEEGRYSISPTEEAPDAVIVRSQNLHSYQFPPSLLAIARAGAGVNTIPVDECSKRGIVVFNTPGANANAVKEMTIMALIMTARNAIEAVEWTKGLNGDDVAEQAEKGKGQFAGNELIGKTLGIIGLGATGAMVAQAALSLGMNVMGVDPHMSLHSAWKLNSKVKPASEEELIRLSDFITIHAPLTDETKGKYDEEFISKTKKGVVLLNFSRAAIGSPEALKKALDSGHVKKYVVDFPTKELLNYPGVLSFPHLASGTAEAEDNCAYMAAEEIKEYLENGNIRNSVNFPSCEFSECTSASRIGVLHRNLPKMLNRITTLISSSGNINIEKLSNVSQGEFAYTIVDIDYPLEFEGIEKIKAIEHVVLARKIK
ncbi:MAG: 3-phosphoglycerate dehydrogenase [Clostridiales bacterium]|nr:3-phosphoglycerate dehydrogenase [Clostridiales bacterium]